MGLLESLEEDMEALEESKDANKPKDEPKDDPQPDPKEEPAAADPANEPDPEEEPEPKDATGWAKHRREKRELEARIREFEEENKKLKIAPVQAPAAPTPAPAPVQSDNPEPDKEKDLAAWLVWNAEEQKKFRSEFQKTTKETQERQKIETLVTSARQEIDQIQDDYRKVNPDFDNAIDHARSEYSRAIKVLNPSMNANQIKQAIDREIFNIALKCNREGTNLGEVLYDLSIERFGYEKEQDPQPNIETPAKPNLKVIANNKKRSASPLEGGGQRSKGRITMAQAADMSPAELQALSAEDWAELKALGF